MILNSSHSNLSITVDQFIDILRMEHGYQHHVAEGSQVHLRTRKKIDDQIDLKLAVLHEELGICKTVFLQSQSWSVPVFIIAIIFHFHLCEIGYVTTQN